MATTTRTGKAPATTEATTETPEVMATEAKPAAEPKAKATPEPKEPKLSNAEKQAFRRNVVRAIRALDIDSLRGGEEGDVLDDAPAELLVACLEQQLSYLWGKEVKELAEAAAA